MSAMQLLILVLLPISAFVCVTALVISWPVICRGFDSLFFRRNEQQTQQVLDDVFKSEMGARGFAIQSWLWVSGAALAVLLLSHNLVFTLAILAAGFFVPGLALEHFKAQHRIKFEHQLPNALQHMVASCRAGSSLGVALEKAAADSEAPLNQEFGWIVRKAKLGESLETAIEATRLRLNSEQFDYVASALIMSMKKGGKLSVVLESLARSFKQLHDLEQQFITASAESRKSARMMTFMPLLIVGMVWLAQPAIIDSITQSVAGWILLGIVIAIFAGAWFRIRALLKVAP